MTPPLVEPPLDENLALIDPVIASLQDPDKSNQDSSPRKTVGDICAVLSQQISGDIVMQQ